MGLYPTALVRILDEIKKDQNLKNKSLCMIGKQVIHMNESIYNKILSMFELDRKLHKLYYNNNVDSFEFFKGLGFGEVHAIDVNKNDGADIIFDLNTALPKEQNEQFDYIINGGTMEHVFDVSNCMRVITQLLKKGGKMIHICPLSGFVDHGFYSFSPTFFVDFASMNGLFIDKLDIEFMMSGGKWDYQNYYELTSFFSPDVRLIFSDKDDVYAKNLNNYIGYFEQMDRVGHVYLWCIAIRSDIKDLDVPMQGYYKRIYNKEIRRVRVLNKQYEYSEEFYENINRIKLDEKEVIPYIMKRINPTSVVDFGCGEGNWLAEIKKIDKDVKILGLDGSYVKTDRLSINKDEFKPVDLRHSIKLDHKYDLAMSLEVAEHIEEDYSDVFIENLTEASDKIFFSAAIPGQGGVHHVNEQWQSYWIKKFAKRGYGVDFSIRDYFWNNPRLNSWRRQNMLLFSKDIAIDKEYEGIVDVVHPQMLSHSKELIEFEVTRNLRYMINCPDIFDRIKLILDKYAGKIPVVIYPYGRNGKLSEMLLKHYYCTDKYYLLDNKMWDDGNKLRTIDFIAKMKDEYILIDVCSNPSIHKELIEVVKERVGLDKLITVFDETI